MKTREPPFEHFYDLADLSEAGAEMAIRPSAQQRSQLAQWAGVTSVDRFEATVTLRRRSASRFAYDAVLAADIEQSCVVTLEPVRSHIGLNIHRELHVISAAPKFAPAGGEIATAGDEGPEEIEGTRFDLAAPVLEEFLLAIDPYPRAPGVEFVRPPSPEAPPESPFAVLGKLKGKS